MSNPRCRFYFILLYNFDLHIHASVCVYHCSCVPLCVYVYVCVYIGIGFLKEWQRLNVAITRAKFAVWIVGHAETLGADSEWKHLIDFTKVKK